MNNLCVRYHKPSVYETTDRSPSWLKCTSYSFLPSLDSDFKSISSFSHQGGRLTLPESNISLTVPEDVIGNEKTEDLYLAVIHDRHTYPPMEENQTLLSPIIVCGNTSSEKQIMMKPVILSFSPLCVPATEQLVNISCRNQSL